MNPPKCNDLDYIHFLIAAQKTFTCTEAARCQPQSPNTPADVDAQYWGTNDIEMTEEKRAKLKKPGWVIEVYHRALKQCCGAEREKVRKAVAILKHLLLCLRAFLRLEVYRLRTGMSWYEAKAVILRDAVRAYLAQPPMNSSQLHKSCR